jgi:hypothetical protein
MHRRLFWLLTATISSVACSGTSDPGIKACPEGGGTPVSLAQFHYVSLDVGTTSGCAAFPATASGAEYLVVPQLATGTPGQMTTFQLPGDTIRISTSTQLSPTDIGGPRGSAERFHTFLRIGDERRSWGLLPNRGASPSAPSAAIPGSSTAGPPGMNTLRTFMVCAKVDCSRFDKVAARVRALKTKVAIYVDTLAPAGGLDSTALDSIANVFDQRLYGIDTAAFGRESDIDANSVVLVLMTNVVNKLITSTECQQHGFVAGFFFGADLDPAFRNDSRSNKGEVIYSVVADPNGDLSCSHHASEILAFIPVTFVHEFQHMISYNQHVLVRPGNGEILWLNEGFSHYAEELGGRSYASTPDARITDCPLNTTECRFYSGDLLNAYKYLDSTQNHFLLPTAGIGTLAERGAAWLFVRYVVDRYSSGPSRAQWDALTRSLVSTPNTGAQNIAAVTGEPFATVVSRWALANWVTDNGAAPPELQYDSWALHSVFAALNARSSQFPKPYPLTPGQSLGRDVDLTGTLRAGSGIYLRAMQAAGDPGFTLHLTTPNGALINPAYAPRLNVIRLQ